MSNVTNPAKHHFFTVGYQAYSVDSIIAELKANGVELLIDVRENPFSFKSGFSRNSLAAILSAAGTNCAIVA